MAKKRYASGGITISMGGGQSSDGIFGEKANSGNQYPFPNGNAGNAPPPSDQSSGTSQTFNIQPSASASPTSDSSNSDDTKSFKRGGKVKSSASKRGDGIAQRGKTRGKYL
jgi:hypothetical protein